MNLAQHLAAAMADHPDRPALVFIHATGPDTVLSYRQLDELSAQLAGGLGQLGLGPGARVILLAPVSPLLYGALIALFRLGATAVFLDPRAGRGPLERAASAARADALVGTPAALALRRLSPALRRIPLALGVSGLRRPTLERLARDGPSRPELADVGPRHPALVTFTGGSTGTARDPGVVLGPAARGVVRSHGVLEAQHQAIGRALPVEPGDVDLVMFPVLVLHNLASGVPSLVPPPRAQRPDPATADALIAAVGRWGANTAAGAPAFWEGLADRCRERGRTLGFRRIVTGGAPVDARLVALLAAMAPGAQIVSVYGSSEVEPVATITGTDVLALAGAMAAGAGAVLGRPVPEARVRVLDALGRDVADGRPGELWVAGPHVAIAGLTDALDSDAGLTTVADPAIHAGPDGDIWHPMGDIGYRDAAGWLWQLGRTHTVLSRADGPLFPVPVEAAVATLPFVARAALVGIPTLDPSSGRDGHTVLATVLRAGAPPDWRDQVRHCLAGLAAAPFAAALSPADPPTTRSGTVDEIRAVRDLPLDARHRSRVDQARLRRQLIDAHWPRHFRAYLAERFPPIAHGLLIVSYFAANAFLAQASTAPDQPLALSWGLAAGALALFLMFFHLRVVDEHKDYAADLVVHPQRVLSRGLVTLAQLRRLGLAAVALELALSWALGPAALLACLLVLGLSLLIAQDFFLGPRLERHMLANAFVHLAIMPAYSLFAYAVATGRPLWTAPAPVLWYAWVGYCVGLAFELARKTRAPVDERPGLVTYSRDLGPYRPAYLMLAAISVAAALSWHVGSLLALGPWYHLAVFGLLSLVAVGVLDFRLHTTAVRANRLKGYAGAYIFAFDVFLSLEIIHRWGIGAA